MKNLIFKMRPYKVYLFVELKNSNKKNYLILREKIFFIFFWWWDTERIYHIPDEFKEYAVLSPGDKLQTSLNEENKISITTNIWAFTLKGPRVLHINE